jgi:hypothetical protein
MAVQKPRRDPTKPLPAGVRPLDPNDYAFYGFGDLGRFGFLQEVGIRSGDPRVSVVEDGIFVPSEKTTKGWPAQVGGIVTGSGKPIEAANLRRLGTAIFAGLADPIEVGPAYEVDEEVIYLGWLFDAYGHLLLESLARAWFLREIDPSVRVLFHVDRHPHPGGITRQVLETFGIPFDRILLLDRPTRIRRIQLPEPLYELGYVAHERAAESHRHAAERIVGNAAPSQQPLYLSRRLLASDQRAVVGEAELEDLLRENGFRIAHPETMSFEDQVRMLNGHADIFACDGSAAHGVLFSLGAPRLHYFIGDVVSPDYFLSSTVAGASTTFVNCLDRKQGPAFGRSFPHIANLEMIARYLREHGFLRKHSLAEPAVHVQELRARYEELWLCRRVRLASEGRPLPPADETEARRMATTSWPLSWMLLGHDVQREDLLVEDLATQFADLLEAERDPQRVAYFRREITRDAASILPELGDKCGSETVDRLTGLLARHSMLKVSAKRREAAG